MSEEKTPPKSKQISEKERFISINEYFEANFNAAMASAIVFHHPVRKKQ